jgi:hypothetical protein
MSKYILIQNDGEIETNSFELIGASTKRNDNTKIGFFGSGLKYSIAYMMRSGIKFRVFSGEKEIIFTAKTENFRAQDFQRICINGIPTSYTTTMGPTWKEDWFVLREIYCNALDEAGCQIVKETENVFPSAGKTRIFIEATESLAGVVHNWNAYFADERTPIFIESSDVYTCMLGTEDNATTRQPIQVYHKTDGVVYRKGIRVFEDKSLMYDYNFAFVSINEDRTAKSITGLTYAVLNLFARFSDEAYIKNVLRTSVDDTQNYEYRALGYTTPDDKISTQWVRFSEENLLVVKEKSGKYAEEIRESKKEAFLIPMIFARQLKKNQPDCRIMGMGSILGKVSAEEIELTAKMQFLLKEVRASLEEMKYHIHYEIKAAIFDNDEVLGKADMTNKTILIADKTFDLGRREIAMTLMEENEHLKSGKEDETRAFQNHIFSQWLTSMENANGLFL